MKNFFTLLIAALFFVTMPAQAQKPMQNVWNKDFLSINSNDSVEKFYDSLPKAKGDYKSRVRPLLLEGAMNIETEVLIRALKNPVAYNELNYLFVAGTYKNYPVVVVRTEIGTINAGAATALAIKKFNPVAVINQGTAGGYGYDLKVGDIVIGERTFNRNTFKLSYSPAGAGIDMTKQEMLGVRAYDATNDKFQPYKEFIADPTLLNIAFKVANAHEEFNAVSGVLGTGDSWLENVDYTNFLHETYGSSCEEMETNAVAAICQNASIPFIGIRVISNNTELRAAFDKNAAKIGQDFVLLVAENYINDILKR
ncbi:MAG: 5'-methylthioadenosine/S-adenosylhomocysteine nucleosidase [Selenomonadaceae bacterium]|nr:5'-methylthioadenosine/S-adenosylhomocysteine nucleosidase [Selenomonadaceae bacterium]